MECREENEPVHTDHGAVSELLRLLKEWREGMYYYITEFYVKASTLIILCPRRNRRIGINLNDHDRVDVCIRGEDGSIMDLVS